MLDIDEHDLDIGIFEHSYRMVGNVIHKVSKRANSVQNLINSSSYATYPCLIGEHIPGAAAEHFLHFVLFFFIILLVFFIFALKEDADVLAFLFHLGEQRGSSALIKIENHKKLVIRVTLYRPL